MPPLPKASPARRNKHTSRATLTRQHDVKMPPLPDRVRTTTVEGETIDEVVDWHEMTLSWWADIWASPMAPEFEQADVHGLFVLAALVDEFWRNPKPALAAEIRLQRMAFGLTPIDRRRLQWEIERGDDAAQKTAQRRAAKQQAPKEPAVDPRTVLKLA